MLYTLTANNFINILALFFRMIYYFLVKKFFSGILYKECKYEKEFVLTFTSC